MSIQRTALFFTLASGLALTACNRNDTAPAPSAPAEESGTGQTLSVPAGFAQEYRDLKAGEQDPKKLAAGVRELLSRYRLPVPGHSPDPSLPGPMALPAAEPEPSTGPLGKAAATAAARWYMAKGVNFGLDIVMVKTMTIPGLCGLSASLTHDAATSALDPFLVAFTKPSGAGDPNLTKVSFVGISDDDAGNFDSKFTWVNSSTSSKTVTLVAFAYLPEVAGVGTLNAQCVTATHKSCGSLTSSSRISGVAVRENEALSLSRCTGPTKSNVSLTINDGGDHGPGVLAVNAQTYRGGYIFNQEGTLALDDVLTTQYPNLVLGFSTGIGGFPCGNGLTCFEPSSFTLFQGDNYTCP